jgi:hypothetical protein
MKKSGLGPSPRVVFRPDPPLVWPSELAIKYFFLHQKVTTNIKWWPNQKYTDQKTLFWYKNFISLKRVQLKNARQSKLMLYITHFLRSERSRSTSWRRPWSRRSGRPGSPRRGCWRSRRPAVVLKIMFQTEFTDKFDESVSDRIYTQTNLMNRVQTEFTEKLFQIYEKNTAANFLFHPLLHCSST